MADVIYNPVAGVPFSAMTRYVDLGDGSYAPNSTSVGPSPLASLTNTSASGPGAVLDNHGTRNNHVLVVTTSAGVSGGVVTLEASQDGVNWWALGATSALTASKTVAAANTQLTPVRYLRANITTPITGGTATAYVAST